MLDPCKNCLIIACCTEICENKSLYNLDIRFHFEKLCSKHIYSQHSGKKKKKIPKKIQTLADSLRKQMVENKRQNNLRIQRKWGIEF